MVITELLLQFWEIDARAGSVMMEKYPVFEAVVVWLKWECVWYIYSVYVIYA